jgi:P27 family predicted phage terminase small subunit
LENKEFDYSKPPKNLSNESKAIWTRLNEEYNVDESWWSVLKSALEAYDRVLQCQKIIAEDGMVIKNAKTKNVKPHPLLSAEDKARTAFIRAWKSLNLDIEPPMSNGRPPGRR